MTDRLEATLKNPRWWITLPFTLFIMGPIILVQLLARLVAFMAHSVDEGIEEIAGAINTPVHNWWKRDVQRRRAARGLEPADI